MRAPPPLEGQPRQSGPGCETVAHGKFDSRQRLGPLLWPVAVVRIHGCRVGTAAGKAKNEIILGHR